MAKEEKKKVKDIFENSDNLSDEEVLESIIRYTVVRRKANEVARDLMAEFGSFARVMNATKRELKAIPGMGEAACSTIILFKSFYRKYKMSAVKKGITFANRDELGRFVCDCMIGRGNEVLLVICLNDKSKLIAWKAVQEGSLHHVDINPRDILVFALDVNASKIIIAHNHIDGVLCPSREDFEITENLCEAFKSVGIMLLDHIITCNNEYVSLARLSGE